MIRHTLPNAIAVTIKSSVWIWIGSVQVEPSSDIMGVEKELRYFASSFFEGMLKEWSDAL
jgi:hypothetical protein